MARPALRTAFRLGMWWAEAVGEWMVRLARLHRAAVSYRGQWRTLILVGKPAIFGLWLVTRMCFVAVYHPTRWAALAFVRASQ